MKKTILFNGIETEIEEMEKKTSLFDVIKTEIKRLEDWDFFETYCPGKILSYPESIKEFINSYEELEKLIAACKKIYPGVIRDNFKAYEQVEWDIEEYEDDIFEADEHLKELSKEEGK